MPPVNKDAQQIVHSRPRADKLALKRFGQWWESLFVTRVEEKTVSQKNVVQDAA